MLVMDNLFTIIFFVNILLSIVIIFRERRQTAQTWAWLLVLLFIPVVGFVLYFSLVAESPKKNFRFEDTSQNWFERGAGRAKASAAAESLSPSTHCASRSQAARLFIDDLWSVVIYHYK